MKWCNQCKVHVDTDYKICPLCYNPLQEEETKENNHFRNYPPRKDVKRKVNLLYRILIFLCLLSISSCVVVNLLTHVEGEKWWCLYVVVGVAYLFILARSTLFARINLEKKLAIQEIFISLVIVCIDILSENKGWGLAIVVPSICMATNIASICIIIAHRKNFGSSLVPVFVITLLGIIPYVLQLFGLVKGEKLWAPLASCFLSGAIFVGFIIFGGREIYEELKKRFHI